MKSKLQRKNVIIKNCIEDNNDFMELYHIFRSTLRHDMSFRELKFYYYSKKLEYIDVTFLCDGNDVCGFCAAAFYRFDTAGGSGTIGRSAIGLLNKYQGKALPKWVLYYKYIRYKKSNPFKKLILSAYVANPLVYSMICKYTAIVYPRNTVEVNEKITKLKELVLCSSGLRNRESAPFTVQIHFDVQKGEKLVQRIKESSDRHVQFFVKQTGLREQITLLVIIPISWRNITLTSGRFIKLALGRTCNSIIFIRSISNNYGKAVSTILGWSKKTSNHLLQDYKKAINLVVNNCKKAIKHTEDANWKRLRTLFTKQ